MAGTDIDINDPKVQRVLIILLIGIVVSSGIVWFLILPVSKEFSGLETERDEKRRRVTGIKNVISELKNLESDVKRLEYECDSLKQKFLDNSDISSLLNNLARIAASEGLKASDFKPDEDNKRKKVIRPYYIEQRYQVVLIGGYHQIGSFLEELTKLDLILKVSDMKIEPSEGSKELYKNLSLKEYGNLEQVVPSIKSTFYLTTFSHR